VIVTVDRMRGGWTTATLLALLGLGGCGRSGTHFFGSREDAGDDSNVAATESDGLSATGAESSGGSSSTGEPNCVDSPELCTVQVTLRRAVDILFVVDNSGSMGGEQGTLAASFGSFIDVLESQQVGANYRIGITTTAGTGLLRATSCRSRLDEFLFSWQFGDLDERQRGCLENCDLDVIDVSEPWIEKGNGGTNLPPGIGVAEALKCVGPQGINGPGFERQLESMRNALVDDTVGFLRDDALLAIILVTDEADCSASDDSQYWLETEGWVFWSNPERASSGACWNAGVTCVGGPGVYDDCFSQDKNRQGQPTSDPDDAVLYPLDRYRDALTDISAKKQALGGQGEVLVALLAGVPLDYPQTGVLTYEDSPSEEFNVEYGIGPGCGHGTESINELPGIPPVRLREFAEAFEVGERNIFSICDDDYGIAMTQIAAAIGDINERACVSGCVVDQLPDSPGLQPDCTLTETFTDAPDRAVPPCDLADQGWEFPAPDVHACYLALTDTEAETLTKVDDMSPQCVTVGSNLEYVIARRKDVPVPTGTSIEVRCQLTAPVGTSCDEK
jgi:hypothetical protein